MPIEAERLDARRAELQAEIAKFAEFATDEMVSIVKLLIAGPWVSVTLPGIESPVSFPHPVRRRREPVTDERLREFAEAYKTRYMKGRPAEFAQSVHLSERQMWRYVKLAREHGFLPAHGETAMTRPPL